VTAGAVDELVDSLLYEGYALYPYTPDATKNATPTPFGIVYSPDYAERLPSAHDHLRLECALVADTGVTPRATVRFLQSHGERHRALERRIELAGPGEAVPFDFDGVTGRARLRLDPLPGGLQRVRVCVHNTTPMAEPDTDRAEALRSSLLSTHVVVSAPGGRFVSPLETPDLQSVNTFPVLASDSDDTVVGAAIVLPDHPQISPHSRGNLFDGTEIEEALLLHVQTLSDGERESIADQDPAVRAMIQRAAAATPDDVMALHGVMRPSEQLSPPEPPERLPALTGDDEVVVGEHTFRKGGTVKLNPADGGDPYDLMVRGREATIERILHDVDGRLYFAVTVDGDPGQDLLRDTNRFLYFFSEEILPA
jgi:hypothetical protein